MMEFARCAAVLDVMDLTYMRIREKRGSSRGARCGLGPKIRSSKDASFHNLGQGSGHFDTAEGMNS
jgi:hypothetical protein